MLYKQGNRPWYAAHVEYLLVSAVTLVVFCRDLAALRCTFRIVAIMLMHDVIYKTGSA